MRHRTPFADTWPGPLDYARNCARGEGQREVYPQHAIDGLAVYLAAEQRLGRMAEMVILQAAAKCLWMISIQTAMDGQLMEQTPDTARIRQVIHQYVQTLMTCIEPHRKTEEKIGFKKSK